MRQFQLNVSSRDQVGTRASGRLRREGKVPAVIYGKHSAPRNLSIDGALLKAMMRQVGSSVALVELDEEGKKSLAILQKVERHAFKDYLVHVDFHEISPDEPLHIHLPVHLKGEAPGVTTEGGTLNIVLHTIDVRALPHQMPSFIEIDISSLKIGEPIHVRELKPLPGVTFLAPADQVVVSINAPIVEAEPAPAEAAPAAPAKPAGKGKK